MLAQELQNSGNRAVGVTTRREGLGPDQDDFEAAAELVRQRRNRPLAIKVGKNPAAPWKTSPAAGNLAEARSAETTPLCDAKPTPNRLLSDGAAVLLPATVERQKAMRALCMPCVQAKHCRFANEGKPGDGAACGFGLSRDQDECRGSPSKPRR
jgi:hypothetical protein